MKGKIDNFNIESATHTLMDESLDTLDTKFLKDVKIEDLRALVLSLVAHHRGKQATNSIAAALNKSF